MGKGIVKLGQGQWAVKDGNLLAAKETNGRFKNAEFTVARGTRATYVGRDGLIKESNLQDTNLVNNGDFEELGSELVTNGTFDTDSDWSKSNSTVSGGKGNLDGDGQTALLWQDVLTNGKTYKANFTVSDYNGLGQARIINNDGGVIYNITSNNTFTIYFTHSIASGNFLIQAKSGAVFSIDNVSVKQVDPNDRWIPTNGATITGGVLNIDYNLGNGSTTQSNVFTIGKTYKIQLNVDDSSTGTARINSGVPATILSNGLNTFYIEATGTTLEIRNHVNFVGSIDNISVKEIKTDTPRIDFTDNTDGHLLLEPQSTNLVNYSEDFSGWTNTASETTDTANSATSPSGESNATKLQEANSSNSFHRLSKTISLSSATDYSLSIFAKKGTLSNMQLMLLNTSDSKMFSKVFDLENGTLGETLTSGGQSLTDSKIEDMGNGWYRCSIVGQLSTTPNTFRINLANASTGNTSSNGMVQYAGDGSGNIYIYGAQLEALSYATSYIPTKGSTVTRDGETCTGAGEAVDFNSSEGVLYIETAALANDGTFRILSISDGTLYNEVALYYRNNDNRITARLRSGSGSQVIFESFNLTAINFSKVAFRYKSGESNVFIDGVKQKASDYTTTSMPVGLSSFQFTEGWGSLPFYGKCKGIRVYKEALSDSELITLTS